MTLGDGFIPYSFVQEAPQISRHSPSLALQPFHTPVDPDRGQHAAGDRPNDHLHAKSKVLTREPFESALLDELADA